MNTNQARIWALLGEAAEEHRLEGRVGIDLQYSLATEGYDLSSLADDIQNLNS